jgi:hypothetical protein
MRKINFGSIHNFLDRRIATSHANNLRAVISFPPASPASLTRLRAALVAGLGQLIAGVVDHVELLARWKARDLNTGIAFGEDDDGDQQQALEHPRHKDAAIREYANGGLSRQTLGRSSERRT